MSAGGRGAGGPRSGNHNLGTDPAYQAALEAARASTAALQFQNSNTNGSSNSIIPPPPPPRTPPLTSNLSAAQKPEPSPLTTTADTHNLSPSGPRPPPALTTQKSQACTSDSKTAPLQSPRGNAAKHAASAANTPSSIVQATQKQQQQTGPASPQRPSSAQQGRRLNGQDTPPSSPPVSGRNGNGWNSSGGGNRNTSSARFFEEHLSEEQVKTRLLEGGLIQGVLRVNKNDATEGFVSVTGIEGDVQVRGNIHQNRALVGDTVALQILPLSKWWEVRTQGSASSAASTPPARLSSAQEHPWAACTTSKEVLAVVAKILIERPELRVKAKVVSIVQKCPTRERLVGIVRTGGGTGGAGMTFIPLLPYLPHMDVKESEVAHLPEDLQTEAGLEDVETRTLMAACLLEWPASSSRPTVSLRHSLGQTGQIESETAAILEMEGVRNIDFGPAVLQCLPGLPWNISEDDLKGRRDFRSTRLFTIDPPTAKDLDDALHIQPMPGGGWQVGVHIADVAHFIPPFSALDVEAGMRATSVYLIQRVIPMLPPLLCEQLCSLNPGVDRLAFSVVWDLDANGKILSQWAGRSVICSCAKLAYPMVQAMIEGRFQRETCKAVIFGFNTWDEVIGDSLALNTVAVKLRAARFQCGALTMDNIKLSYVMDKDGDPVGFSQYVQSDANHLVEEFMLLANMSVATIISDAFPDRAMLRRHGPPMGDKLKDLQNAALAAGLTLDLSNVSGLQEPLARIRAEVEDKGVADMLVLMATRPMQLAKYFSTGELVDPAQWAHYALAVPAYTHFTSPIRRYPDVVVHRLLAAALDMRESGLSIDEVAAKHQLCNGELTGKVAEHCNNLRISARDAQDASQKLYLAVMTCKRPAITNGVVMQLKGEKFFELYLPEYGVICNLQTQDIGVPYTSSWGAQTKILTLQNAPEGYTQQRHQQRRNPPNSDNSQAAPMPDFAPWIQSLPAIYNPHHITPVVLPLHLQLLKTFPVVLTSVMKPGVPSELIARIYLDVGLNLAVVANETAAAAVGEAVPSCIPQDVLYD